MGKKLVCVSLVLYFVVIIAFAVLFGFFKQDRLGSQLFWYLVVFDLVPIVIWWFLLAIALLDYLRPVVNKTVVLTMQAVYSKEFSLLEKQQKEDLWITYEAGGVKVYFPKVINGMLIFLFYSICATSIAAFWDKAVIQFRKDQCIVGDEFNCYLQGSRLRTNALDCGVSNYSDSAIVCYSLRFDYGSGIADAGGIFSASSVALMVVAKVIIHTRKGLRWCCSKCMKRQERFVMVTLWALQTLSLFLIAIALGLVLSFTPLWNRITMDFARLLKIISISVTIYVTLWIPWYWCYFETEDKKK